MVGMKSEQAGNTNPESLPGRLTYHVTRSGSKAKVGSVILTVVLDSLCIRELMHRSSDI